LALAKGRDLAAEASPPPWRRAGGRWQAPPTQCRDHRSPVGDNDRNRGRRGFDAHKHVTGRTRHLLVDTLGLILAVVVTAASVQDRDGAKIALAVLRHKFSRLGVSWADQAYAGQLIAWVKAWRVYRPVRLVIVKRAAVAQGFVVSPKRWIVERTLGWCNRYRRLSKDDELLPQTSEAVIQVMMIHLMIRRLARIAPY
jgi:putative transposase